MKLNLLFDRDGVRDNRPISLEWPGPIPSVGGVIKFDDDFQNDLAIQSEFWCVAFAEFAFSLGTPETSLVTLILQPSDGSRPSVKRAKKSIVKKPKYLKSSRAKK